MTLRVLLTGVSGQVGGEILRQVPAGDAFDLRAPPRADLDLADAATVDRTLREHAPQLVVNAAAYTAVDRAEDEPERALRVNGTAVGQIAQWCAAHRVPLIHYSTDYVFDGRKAGVYDEDDPPAPAGAYGRSKLAGDEAIRAAGARHIILRVAWVFAGRGANFVRTMLRLARERPELRVVDDQVGAPTHAADIAHVTWTLVQRYARDGALAWGTYQLPAQPQVSWHGFAGAIVDRAAALGLITQRPLVQAIATRDYPTKAQRPANSCMSGERLRRTFGIDPPDWRARLDETLRQLAAL